MKVLETRMYPKQEEMLDRMQAEGWRYIPSSGEPRRVLVEKQDMFTHYGYVHSDGSFENIS